MPSEARFFGPSQAPLYGVFHAPESDVLRRAAVLLVPEGVQDSMASHWAYRRLARSLAREGFEVLRFDYRGTGDSSGDERSLALWRQDVAVAAEELLDTSGASELLAVGRGLGAALLSEIACAAAVMWDPVFSGREYLAQLRLRDQRREWWARVSLPLARGELVGYAHSEQMERELAALVLHAPSARELFFVAENESASLHAFLRGQSGARFERVSEDKPSRPDEPILPQRAIARITAFIAEVAP